MHLFSAGYYPAFGELILPDRDEVMSNSSLSTEVRGIEILGSSELPWYSDDLCATAHIHPPHTGVCWLRYVAC